MPLLSSVLQRWPIYLFSALIILIALDTTVGERGALHLWRLRGEKNRLDEQNFRIQKENEVLRERVYRLRNDNAFLEKLAREELNLVRPGEVVYRFPNRETRRRRAQKYRRARLDQLDPKRHEKMLAKSFRLDASWIELVSSRAGQRLNDEVYDLSLKTKW